jgi:hypothetical protein
LRERGYNAVALERVIRLIATIVGLGVGILDKFVLGSGWIPAIGLTILVFLAIPFITGLVFGRRWSG